jgi:hypothetical protein
MIKKANARAINLSAPINKIQAKHQNQPCLNRFTTTLFSRCGFFLSMNTKAKARAINLSAPINEIQAKHQHSP